MIVITTEVVIEDDGNGYPKDVLSKIGEPYIKSFKPSENSKSGLGLRNFYRKNFIRKKLCKYIM